MNFCDACSQNRANNTGNLSKDCHTDKLTRQNTIGRDWIGKQ